MVLSLILKIDIYLKSVHIFFALNIYDIKGMKWAVKALQYKFKRG